MSLRRHMAQRALAASVKMSSGAISVALPSMRFISGPDSTPVSALAAHAAPYGLQLLKLRFD